MSIWAATNTLSFRNSKSWCIKFQSFYSVLLISLFCQVWGVQLDSCQTTGVWMLLCRDPNGEILLALNISVPVLPVRCGILLQKSWVRSKVKSSFWPSCLSYLYWDGEQPDVGDFLCTRGFAILASESLLSPVSRSKLQDSHVVWLFWCARVQNAVSMQGDSGRLWAFEPVQYEAQKKCFLKIHCFVFWLSLLPSRVASWRSVSEINGMRQWMEGDFRHWQGHLRVLY